MWCVGVTPGSGKFVDEFNARLVVCKVGFDSVAVFGGVVFPLNVHGKEWVKRVNDSWYDFGLFESEITLLVMWVVSSDDEDILIYKIYFFRVLSVSYLDEWILFLCFSG